MTKINLSKHIWEGWTVGSFIDELEPAVEMIMSGNSWREPFQNRAELNQWLKDNQPYYKKDIKEVQQYFAKKFNII